MEDGELWKIINDLKNQISNKDKQIEELKTAMTNLYENKAIEFCQSSVALKVIQEQYRMQGRAEMYEDNK